MIEFKKNCLNFYFLNEKILFNILCFKIKIVKFQKYH